MDMPPRFLALAAIGIVSSALAAPSVVFHRGSTRDWVKRYGAGTDSLRYHLEFIDSKTSFHAKSAQIGYSRIVNDSSILVMAPAEFVDTAIDWRVRITSPETPSLVDTAVLRIHSGAAKCDSPGVSVEGYRIEKLVYWIEPSEVFPIDLTYNDPEQVRRLSYYGYGTSTDPVYALTGSTELAALNDRLVHKVRIRYADGILSYQEYDGGFSHSEPTITNDDRIGITSWSAHGNLWTLTAWEGPPLPQSRRGLGHGLRKGESWVYRDTSTDKKPLVAWISLELLDNPTDSAGWTCLKVRESRSTDTGKPSDTTLEIRLDTLRQAVRVHSGSKEVTGTPWSIPSSMEANWALGLLTHPVHPDGASPRYWELSGKSQGGELSQTTILDSFEMLIQKDIGSTRIHKIRHNSSYPVFNEKFAWTLVSHSLDNSILPASPKIPRTVRDINWLRARLAQDPTLEVVRIQMDGVQTRARGARALELLDARGIGFVQVRDGQESVQLRVVRP